MAIFDTFIKNLIQHGLEYFKRYYGIYYGICEDNEDPKENGRILVRVPLITGLDVHPVWAVPIAPWAGKDSGFFCMPDEKDGVWVTFENGDKRCPQWIGGWWPFVGGTSYAAGMSPYTDGKPTKRIFRTKAGHELSFEDNQGGLACKFIWHDPEKDTYTFIAMTPEGSLQMANHKGCLIELRAKDGDELVMIVDQNKNIIVQDKDGTKISDPFGNVIELKEDTIQIIGKKDVVINSQSINLKTGGVSVGDVTTDSAVKGTTFLQWWTSALKVWLDSHTHGTPVGPSSQPLVPSQAPVSQMVLTDKLKMQ